MWIEEGSVMTGTPESIQKVEDLDDLIRRDRSIGMTIFEMRRYVRELDDKIDSCDLPGAFHPFYGAEVLSQVATSSAIQERSNLSEELYHQILEEVDETSKHLLAAGRRAKVCKCRKQ